MHQLAEYILGGALVASGLQSQTPIVPSVVGGLIMLNAAITKGALAAFQGIPRRVHRQLDLVVIAITFIAALQPWWNVESGARFIMIAIGVVHLVVWTQSSFKERVKTPKAAPAAEPGAAATGGASGDRSTDLGRTAGRLVGGGFNAVRRAKAKFDGDSTPNDTP
jgi:hypothetical protein